MTLSTGQARTESSAVLVVFLDDMKGSMALKESIAANQDEHSFHDLRKEHDALLTSIITRDGAGEVIKSTGDGLLAVFHAPSTAVERAVEIQERLHGHPRLSVRIGMDMGEVRVESSEATKLDVFGLHVDIAARAMSLVDGGHIGVTRSVYVDAFSWITKNRIAWQEHGHYRAKAADTPVEVWEPHNANVVRPMEKLRGEKVTVASLAPSAAAHASGRTPATDDTGQHIGLARSWESVARDGRDFAEKGAGMMYWFKVPLGGVCYPEGFRNFLQPALTNPRIGKIRFVLDSASPTIRATWDEMVLPLIDDWAKSQNVTTTVHGDENGGRVEIGGESKRTLGWIFIDLSREYSPSFKLFVEDPDEDVKVEAQAQIFLSTAARTVRLKRGGTGSVRIPDTVLRVRSHEADSLIHALNSIANQWDSLF